MDVVGAFIGIDGFQVHQVADDVKLSMHDRCIWSNLGKPGFRPGKAGSKGIFKMGGPSRSKLSSTDLQQRLGAVKLLSLDVDGVLTDGGLYFTDDGSQLRKFNVKDGEGIKRLLEAAVEVVIISAGQAKSILKRGESLGLEHVFIGVEDKLAALSALCSELAMELADVAHMGDDLNDLSVLEAVGLPLSVADAMPEVRKRALYVTERGGGEGAVREICDLLLAARK